MILNNGESLAYIGDAIYELNIRSYLLDKGFTSVDKMHKTAINYTSGLSQAKIMKKFLEDNVLTEEETDYYKRGRNSNHSANRRSIDVVSYKMATGFEALFGYLYLKNDLERIKELVSKSIKIIEEE